MLSLSYSLPTPPPFEAVIKSIKGTTFNHFSCLLFNKVTNALDMCLRGKDNVIIYDVNNKHILRHRSVSCKLKLLMKINHSVIEIPPFICKCVTRVT